MFSQLEHTLGAIDLARIGLGALHVDRTEVQFKSWLAKKFEIDLANKSSSNANFSDPFTLEVIEHIKGNLSILNLNNFTSIRNTVKNFKTLKKEII